MATGGLNTKRLSATGGSRTFLSMIASVDNTAGAGSVKRIASWYRQQNSDLSQFYQNILDLQYGQYQNRQEFFLGFH
jgi:hypothetical protein